MKLTVSNANITNTFSIAKMTLANTNVAESITLGNVSVTPSQISVGNVSIAPTTVSVPTLILGITQFSGGLQGGIINYQEFTANGTWYNPYANASVNASLTGYEQVLVMAWGGGGGATSNNNSTSSGGGGACVLGYYTLSQLGSTVSVTVGSGGTAARTTTTALTNAGNGGNSIFSTLVSYGGAGGSSGGGGGGGGTLSAGIEEVGGAPLPGGTPGLFSSTFSTFGGGGGNDSASTSFSGISIFGGGGGGKLISITSGRGGSSIYGGGAGGSGTVDRSGSSVFGGSGGALGGAGNIPGGGGSSNTISSNTGARGEVRVWVFGPAAVTLGAPSYSLTANTTTLYEGSSVQYTVATGNIPNGTTLYYTLNNSSTAVATDFTTAVNGSVIITDGTGTFTLTANNDADSVNEAFTMDIRTASTTGSIVASNGSVSIVPIPYFISSSSWGTSATSSEEILSWSHTTTSDTTCLVVAVEWGDSDGAEDGTVTYNGISLTKITETGVGTNHRTQIFRLFNPPVGTYTISAEFQGTLDRFGAAMAFNLANVTEVNASGTSSTDSNVTSRTVNLTTTKRSVIIALVYGQSNGSTVPDLDVTSPVGTSRTNTATNTSNGIGKRFSVYVTPLQESGSITCTATYSTGTLAVARFVVAAFSL